VTPSRGVLSFLSPGWGICLAKGSDGRAALVDDPTLLALEAGGGVHHWGRFLSIRQLWGVGAMAVIRRAKPDTRKASPWFLNVLNRRPQKGTAVTLAHKVARIVWAMMTNAESDRSPPEATSSARRCPRWRSNGEDDDLTILPPRKPVAPQKDRLSGHRPQGDSGAVPPRYIPDRAPHSPSQRRLSLPWRGGPTPGDGSGRVFAESIHRDSGLGVWITRVGSLEFLAILGCLPSSLGGRKGGILGGLVTLDGRRKPKNRQAKRFTDSAVSAVAKGQGWG
jgi:hypothetical protein